MRNRLSFALVSLVAVATVVGGGTATAHGTSSPSALRVRARVATGDLVGGLASAGGFVWGVATYPRQEVVQIDPATNRVVARIPLGGTPGPSQVAWITYGDGALWVSRSLASEVDRIDPSTRRITARVALDDPYDVAVAGSTVFVPQFDPYQWSTIDATTASVTGSRPATGPSSAVVDNGAIWILAHRSKSILRVDPATNTVTKQIPVSTGGGVPERLAAGFGSLWATDPRSSSIARIDEASGKQVKEIKLPADPLWNPYPIATGAGFVWVGSDHGVGKIDPATNRVVGSLALANDNKTCGPATDYPCTDGIVYADHSVWVADWNKRQVLRIAAP
ncbi:MAG TPA: hypothetical protein VFP22_07550 [Candidatus Limnocylindrales bacterium]|nr:hypothetical protein [Candidatus Limnocylindrales bacterium]